MSEVARRSDTEWAPPAEGAGQPPRPSTARLSAPPVTALLDLERPRAVGFAFRCWVLGGLVAALAAAVGVGRRDALRTEFVLLARESDPAATAETVDRVAMASVLVVLGTGALVGVFVVLLAIAMRSGRNWARVLLVVLALVALVHTAFVASAVTPAMLGDLRGFVVGGLACSAALFLAGCVGMFAGTRAWFHRPVRADGR